MGNTPYSSRHGRPHKSKDELAARIDAKLRDLRLHSGKGQFDPVEMMAVIGAEAYRDGDTQVALVAFKEVACYTRPKLAPISAPEAREEPASVSRVQVLGAFARMGVKIESDDPHRLVRELMDVEGITYEQACERVEQETGLPVLNQIAIPSLPPAPDD